VASANQWPDHRYRETPNRRLHKIPDTTGHYPAIRKSDFLASISLLLVSKSHFLVADELASFSDNLSTLRRTQPVQARGSAARVTPKATTFLKIFRKHRKNERGFPSLADPGISGPE